MFERFTEPARRAVFFARYEASQFGSPYIETEHLLLGLLREDKSLADRVLGSAAAVHSVRSQLEAHTPVREKVSTSVDLPLSHESKRVLAWGAEEAERFNHKEINTSHLLLGLLREEKSFAARLLRERGVTQHSARAEVRPEGPPAQDRPTATAGLDQWVAELRAGGVWTVQQERHVNKPPRLSIYPGPQPQEKEQPPENDPAIKLVQIRARLDLLTEAMERAIANHEFEKARFYSDEERKEHENMRLVRAELDREDQASKAPLLRVEIIRRDRFSDVQKRSDDFIGQGVTEIWILNPDLKRAYTVTRAEGLREFKGEVLRIPDPPLEMDLKKIFDQKPA